MTTTYLIQIERLYVFSWINTPLAEIWKSFSRLYNLSEDHIVSSVFIRSLNPVYCIS